MSWMPFRFLLLGLEMSATLHRETETQKNQSSRWINNHYVRIIKTLPRRFTRITITEQTPRRNVGTHWAMGAEWRIDMDIKIALTPQGRHSYLVTVTSSARWREFDRRVSRFSRYSEQFSGWFISDETWTLIFLTWFDITELERMD